MRVQQIRARRDVPPLQVQNVEHIFTVEGLTERRAKNEPAIRLVSAVTKTRSLRSPLILHSCTRSATCPSEGRMSTGGSVIPVGRITACASTRSPISSHATLPLLRGMIFSCEAVGRACEWDASSDATCLPVSKASLNGSSCMFAPALVGRCSGFDSSSSNFPGVALTKMAFCTFDQNSPAYLWHESV